MSSEEGSRITRSPGEVYPERGAFTDGAVDADGASVPFQDRSAEVEPDAEAALSFGGAAADETLEDARLLGGRDARSEEHTSELQSRVDISYAVFCLKKTNR